MSHYYPRDPSVIGGDGNRRYPVAEEILSTPDNIHSSSSSSSSPRWHVEVPALTASEKSVVLAQYLHDHGRGGPYTAANTTNNNDWNNANKLLNEYCKFMAIKIGNEQQSRPTTLLCPPKTIDDMWVSHLVCTQEYWEFCNR